MQPKLLDPPLPGGQGSSPTLPPPCCNSGRRLLFTGSRTGLPWSLDTETKHQKKRLVFPGHCAQREPQALPWPLGEDHPGGRDSFCPVSLPASRGPEIVQALVTETLVLLSLSGQGTTFPPT